MNFHEVRFPARAVGRVERRAGAAHRDRHAEQRLRGAQLALGAFAAALRRRARGAVAGRPGRAHRLLRGAARAALRVPLEGLDGLQVVRAVGAAVGARTRRSAPATASTTRLRACARPMRRGRSPTCGRSLKPVAGTVRVAVAGARAGRAGPFAVDAATRAGRAGGGAGRGRAGHGGVRVRRAGAVRHRPDQRQPRGVRRGRDPVDPGGGGAGLMRAIDPELQARLDGGATRLCRCWRVQPARRRRVRASPTTTGTSRSTGWCSGRAAAWTRARCSRRPG